MTDPSTLADRLDSRPPRRALAWQAWREAWNYKSSMDTMTDLEERCARNRFERWWKKNHE